MAGAICQSNKDIPIDMTLGNLLYYSLADMKITEKEQKEKRHLFTQMQPLLQYLPYYL